MPEMKTTYLPDINKSSFSYTIDDEDNIVTGFKSIKGLGDKVAKRNSKMYAI